MNETDKYYDDFKKEVLLPIVQEIQKRDNKVFIPLESAIINQKLSNYKKDQFQNYIIQTSIKRKGEIE